jgi:hypothetical protein
MKPFASSIKAITLIALALALARHAPAQISTSNLAPTVVTIRATAPYAAETCGILTVIFPGRFTICRNQGTNIDLLVRYTISGTASNGVDYVTISNAVVIPKGAWSANVIIYPYGDNLIEGTETVVLRLEPVACVAIWPPPPECYLVGQPAEAIVFIRDCVPYNRPPLVRIMQPPSGAKFLAPAKIHILADTVDPDGYVGKVEFFEGSNKIGEQIKVFVVPPTNGTHIPYEMTWTNVPPGAYVLTAQATDNRSAVGISTPVPITVVTTPPPPITNPPPVVTIVATDPVAIEGTNCWGWSNVTNRWPLGTTNCVTVRPNCPIPIWWFTNCGPKNATLTVRRAGDTNAELLVSYSIGGTATNGADYDALPSVVIIPAGARKADIAIVPREDNHPDPIKTVILKLLPPPVLSSTRPPYFVGYPNCAGAIIVDSDRPRPLPYASILPDRCLFIGSDATDGAWYRVECSANLRNWSPICTNQVVQGAIQFVDPEAPDLPKRFYRAVPEANPPAE